MPPRFGGNPNWSIASLRDELEGRGFKSRTTRKIVGKPINNSQLHRLLVNPYYKGQLLFNGVLHDGAHEPLVDDVLWQQVQDVLAGRRIAGDRSWRHGHYLKGALRCGRCEGRVGYATAKGHGGDYDYFFCIARHTGRTSCDLPYLPALDVEDAVARQWIAVRFTDDQIAEFSQRARDDLHRSAESGSRLIADQKRRLAELERHRQQLLDAYMADALEISVLKERQTRVAAEIADARRLIGNAQIASEEVSARLEQVILLLTHAEQLYNTVGPDARQLLNSAVFGPFKIDKADDEPAGVVIAEAPLAPIIDAILATRTEAESAGTPGTRKLAEGSNLSHLAGQLTQRWTPYLWDSLAKVLAGEKAERPGRPPLPKQKQRQVRLSAEQVTALVASYQTGSNLTETAEKYGVCHETVLAHLERHGVAVRRLHGISAEQLEEVRQLRADGWTLATIGKRFGCSRTSVANALKR